jgi:hypothetical protein
LLILEDGNLIVPFAGVAILSVWKDIFLLKSGGGNGEILDCSGLSLMVSKFFGIADSDDRRGMKEIGLWDCFGLLGVDITNSEELLLYFFLISTSASTTACKTKLAVDPDLECFPLYLAVDG